MFFRRGIPRDDPWLGAKLWLFGAGAIVALFGMALHNNWLIGAAGLILLAGLLLRFVPTRRTPAGRGEEEERRSP